MIIGFYTYGSLRVGLYAITSVVHDYKYQLLLDCVIANSLSNHESVVMSQMSH